MNRGDCREPIVRTEEDRELFVHTLSPSVWRFGGKDFVARLLKQLEGRLGESQTHREQHESMEARAQRIIDKELKKAGWSEQRLAKERKGHPLKVKIASRLRQETTMSLKWIADRLKMGTWTYLSLLLHKNPPKNE